MTLIHLNNSLPNRLSKLKQWFWHRKGLVYHRLCNGTVQAQLRDYKSIPIIIISFNQLYYLQQQIDFLLRHGYKRIVVLDNHSTYQPLLAYFETLDPRVTLIRLSENLGHLAFWKSEAVFQTYSKGYYVVSDADIVPVDDCPHDVLLQLRVLLDKAYDRTKVGLSLALDDIPETNPNKAAILNWESQFWTSKLKANVYKAEIDTTFALYRPGYRYHKKRFTKAWRTDFPLQARHGGWYIDPKQLSEEQEYYMKTANASASWQINAQGELVNSIHKTLYRDE
ncbi:glycosyltransferase [Geojedonia litorea]|uniref:Glycosyltransferase n=1 Tax=Geojedonia litorea TaxID=1268269 RepID=A0ABV9N2J8_9FLAO